MTETLLPVSLLDAGLWTNEVGSSGSVASIDEGVDGADDDSTYIEQTDENTYSILKCHLGDPSGAPDTGSGIASWALRYRAKYVNSPAFAFKVELRQGTELITSSEPTLTASWATYLLLFDPGNVTDPDDLRIWIWALADGSGFARVTAVELRIEVFEPGPLDRVRGQLA